MNTLIRRPALWIGLASVAVLVGAAVGFASNTAPVAVSTPSAGARSHSFSASATSASATPGQSPTASASPSSSHTPTVAPSTAAPTATTGSTPRPTVAASQTPGPAPVPATAAVLVGAGDIATSGSGDEATAALIASIPGTVFTAGDNAYPDGAAADFARDFAPSWGRFKARIFPAPGNHDYHVSGAPGYYGYFGARAGGPGGYYAYELGGWRIYSLNSEIISPAEVAWLRSDLAAHPTGCVMAYWHHPLFSSGKHGDDASVRPLWDALNAAGAELVINGHDHDYERFAPQTPTGAAAANGIREIIAGTGGAGLRPIASKQPNSEVFNGTTNGVLKLTLSPTGYRWEFVPTAGASFRDSGTGSCH